MGKRLLIFLLGIALVGFLFIIYFFVKKRLFPYTYINNELVHRSQEPVLAVYDLRTKILFPEPSSIQHVALILNTCDDWEVEKKLLNEIPMDVPVLLTVEMWEQDILQKTAEGKYDREIKEVLQRIAQDRPNIYIRWNPEMEVPQGIANPWANRGSIYPEAFQRFSMLCREQIPHAKITWGPAGYAGNMESYPGDPFIDAASTTINSESETHSSKYKEATIKDQINRKLHRMRFLEVPVFILGSKNTDLENFNDQWITEAIQKFEKDQEETKFERDLGDPEDLAIERNGKPIIGLYDYNKTLIDHEAVSVEHIFIDFQNIRNESLEKDLNEISSRSDDVILTVEPKYNPEADAISDPHLLEDILDGKYDQEIKQLYHLLENRDQTIYLRFAQEMEIPITRYPWQGQDPAKYIKAFRYFMEFPEKELPHVKKVWGPAGDRGLMEFYPGDDVVDIVSIAIYGLPDKNITDPAKQESFRTIFNRKKWRLRFINKPVFITEFGVKGDEEFQKRWLLDAADVINSSPEVIGVNYFNMTDVPKAWGEIKPPDWSISETTFDLFVNKLNKSNTDRLSPKKP